MSEQISQVFHPMTDQPYLQNNPPVVIEKGEGVHIIDTNGNKLLDAVGGLWNVNLGYSCQPVKDAIAVQLETLPFYSMFRGTSNNCALELSDKLREILAQEDMRRFFYTSGGSDAMETAMKLARQYWKIKGQNKRIKFMSFDKSYHGVHFGASSVTGNARFRLPYEPLLPGCHHVPFPDTYRNLFNEHDPDKLSDLCLNFIRDKIEMEGTDSFAAFISEPVLGAGGVFPPPPRFWKRLRQLCDEYEILLISDEVITGFGRTGDWFGCRLWDVKPDILNMAKAITTGYFPFGACAINDKMNKVFSDPGLSDNAVYHGYTYSGHPVGCAAALATIEETFKRDIPGNAESCGKYIINRLQDSIGSHPNIGNIRGKGLMIAIDMVSDKSTRAKQNPVAVGEIGRKIFENGVMVRVSGNLIILSPPLIIGESEAFTICEAIESAIK